MGKGGADRVTLSLLQLLDREKYDASLVLCRSEGILMDDVPTDIPVYSLDVRSILSACLPLARLLSDLRPDVVFSTSSGTNVIAIIARALSGQQFRLVLSERNVLYHGGKTMKRRLLVFLKGRFYVKADRITAVSAGVKRDLVEFLRLPAAKIEVVFNPVVTDELTDLMSRPVEHPWFQDSVPVVLGAGRLVGEKDFTTLINAFGKVRKGLVARLVILGDGPLQSRLMKRVRNLGLEHDVWFAGYDKNPFRYMSRSAVFVLSSRAEGLPGVLIQAMACGAAIVSTDCHSGPSEIITPGVDGWLVPVGDVDRLAEKITFYLTNEEARRRMAESGRVTANRFTAEAVLPNYLEALKDPSQEVGHSWAETSA